MKPLLALLSLTLLFTTSCALADSSARIRYKVTVTMSTPEGDKTGYAVREASRSSERSILPERRDTI